MSSGDKTTLKSWVTCLPDHISADRVRVGQGEGQGWARERARGGHGQGEVIVNVFLGQNYPEIMCHMSNHISADWVRVGQMMMMIAWNVFVSVRNDFDAI